MIISEKQIMHLMDIAQIYIGVMRDLPSNIVTDNGKLNHKLAISIIDEIKNQQSDELKVLE